jgi:hypothetical protein
MFDGYHDMQQLHTVFVEDEHDHARVAKRMRITRTLLETRGVPTTGITLGGSTFLERAFNAIILGHWTALHIAKQSGQDPESVPLIADLKARMQ